MKDIIIGLGICISIYSTFYYLQCKNKKSESKNDKEEINKQEKEEINNDDKSTQTDNIDETIDNKEIIKEVLDDIITSVEKENKDKKTSVSFDEDFEVIQ